MFCYLHLPMNMKVRRLVGRIYKIALKQVKVKSQHVFIENMLSYSVFVFSLAKTIYSSGTTKIFLV